MAVLGLCYCARAFLSCGEQGGYSSLRCVGFSLRWLLLVWRIGSRRGGFRSCGTRAQQLWLTGLVARQHVGSSRTRAGARVPCVGRQILNHYATREVPQFFFLKACSAQADRKQPFSFQPQEESPGRFLPAQLGKYYGIENKLPPCCLAQFSFVFLRIIKEECLLCAHMQCAELCFWQFQPLTGKRKAPNSLLICCQYCQYRGPYTTGTLFFLE